MLSPSCTKKNQTACRHHTGKVIKHLTDHMLNSFTIAHNKQSVYQNIMRFVILLVIISATFCVITGQSDNRARNPPFQPPPFNNTPRRNAPTNRRGGRGRETEGTGGPSEGTPHLNLHRLDNDPAVSNTSNLIRPSHPRDTDETGQIPNPPEGDNLLETAIQLLQRLNDRITALHALDEQQLRRLETLEYRLTKIEVQTQEKTDGIKAELREVSQRVRQLDWQSSKMEATLEAIKLDTNTLKQGQDHIRGLQAGTEGKSVAEGELQNKLQMMMTTIYTVRSAIGSLRDDFDIVKKNITNLSNITSSMAGISGQLLTKQYFTNVMLDFKHESSTPVQAIPQALLASMQQDEPHEEPLSHNCWEIQQQGHNISGIYRIKPVLSTVPFFVYCQMEKHGGGWTVVQNRYEGTVDFYREWQDYKHGFGNIGGEFWLGLEKMHTLTNHKVTELLIELQDFNLENTFAFYTAFAVGTEIEGYPISFLGSYEGDAGDSLIYHAGMKFSTFDNDHDNWHDGNCAESHTGAWWYNGCDTSNLNGRYLNGDLPESFEYQGMYWYDWHGPGYSLMKSRISVRPSKNFHTYIISHNFKESNKTTKATAKKKSQPVNPDHHQRNSTEHSQHNTQGGEAENPGIEDSPPVKENNPDGSHVTEYPEQYPPYDHIYDYQH